MQKKLFFLLAVVIAPIAFAGVSLWFGGDLTFERVYIPEYQGTDLSSVNDFIENSIKGPQFINAEDYELAVTGLVDRNVSYTYEEITTQHQLRKKVVTLYCVEGWEVTILWEGALVKELISSAGINPKANTVIFYAHDGYSTSLPLDYIIENNIMMAHKMNGATLSPERGFPFQLVAESKWGYKWIKWITGIEISDDENFRGYWESLGFSNDADVNNGYLGP